MIDMENIYLPITSRFWDRVSSIETNDPMRSLDERKWSEDVKNGIVYRMAFTVDVNNRLIRATMFINNSARNAAEHHGIHMDGGRCANVFFMKKTGERVNTAKGMLNELLIHHQEYAMLLKAHEWPVDIEIPKDMRQPYLNDLDGLQWMIWGHEGGEETLLHLNGYENHVRKVLNILMGARQDLKSWEIHYKVWRKDGDEVWKLWDVVPQHTNHVDWRMAYKFNVKS